MPRVMVKGFGEVDLPDGMSQEQMRLALRQMYPTSARQSATDALTPIQTADTYEPTLSEMISSGIGETLYDTGIVSDRYRAMDTGRTLGAGASFAPPVASAIAGDAFGSELKQGDYLGATGSAVEGALEVNPVSGAAGNLAMVIGAKAKEFRNDLADVALDYYNKLPKSLSPVQKQDSVFNYMVKNHDTPMYVSPDGQVKQYAENMIDMGNPFITSRETNLPDYNLADNKQLLGRNNAFNRNYDDIDTQTLFTDSDKIGGAKGVYDPDINRSTLALTSGGEQVKPKNLRSTGVHELQHAIQTAEGFGRGYNPQSAARLNESMKPKIRNLEDQAEALAQQYDAIQNSDEVKGLLDAMEVESNKRSYSKLQDSMRSYNSGAKISGNWKNIQREVEVLLGDKIERQLRADMGNLRKARTAKQKSDLIAGYVENAMREYQKIGDTDFANPILDSMTQQDKSKALSRMLDRARKGATEAADMRDEAEVTLDAYNKLFSDPFDTYQSSLGEIEARQAESMINIPMDDLKRVPPSTFFRDRRGNKIGNPLVITPRYQGEVPTRSGTTNIGGVYGDDELSMSLFDQIDTSYRGQHTAPYRDDEGYHSSLDDVTNMFGDDIYTGNAVRYFGVGSDYDQEAVDIIQQMAGDPDGMVTIYRAVPEGVDDINPRDWVTTTKQYALDHIGGDEGYKVISKEVKAKDVFTDGNSIHEFGYDPTDK